jgi:hypothetical protein
MNNFRINTAEKDLAGFVPNIVDVRGYMVVNSPRGRADKPLLIQSEKDVLENFEKPSADYPDLFELVAYTRKAPCWAISPIGDNALYGGIDVTAYGAKSFNAGRSTYADFDFTDETNYSGEVLSYSGLVVSDTIQKPRVEETGFTVKVDDVAKNVSISSGIVTGTDVEGSGTINVDTGVINFEFVSGVVTGSEAVTLDYTSSNEGVSHSFYATSQYVDDLKMDIDHQSGTTFKATLYRKKEGIWETITDYTYSLQKEKLNGRSIYINDIFDGNTYVIPVINSDFSLTGDPFASFVDTTDVLYSGGARGDTVQDSDYVTAWEFAKKTSRYRVTNMVDLKGTQTTILNMNTLITTYQKQAHGIAMIPLGETDSASLILYRTNLNLDSNKVSLYCNHQKIRDPYNDGVAWISGLGSVGGKYVDMAPTYNAESPAGINEDDIYGGQVSDWAVIETEFDFTEQTGGDLDLLNQNQINPIILDGAYGLTISGDKTLEVDPTDTNYVGTRRLYNLIIDSIERFVLKKQVFRLNNEDHRLLAKSLGDNYLSPILSAGYLREFLVVCDESNNTDDALDRREFVYDAYVKVTPNSQVIKFNFIRVGQTISIQELAG